MKKVNSAALGLTIFPSFSLEETNSQIRPEHCQRRRNL